MWTQISNDPNLDIAQLTTPTQILLLIITEFVSLGALWIYLLFNLILHTSTKIMGLPQPNLSIKFQSVKTKREKLA
jgi:hypothetical protein